MSSTSTLDALHTLPGSSVTDKGPIKPKNKMDQQDFINLFTSQLRLQDPMKPVDNSMMMQQMSSLTQLTATQDLQKTIENLNSNMSNSEVMSASQLIGRKVQVPASVSPLDKDGLEGSVVLDRTVDNVDIKITDPETGKLVKTLHLGQSSKGVLDFNWDGVGDDGKPQPVDTFYKIEASASINGKTYKGITAGSFKVSSVTHDKTSGAVILNVNGLGGVGMDDIIKIQ